MINFYYNKLILILIFFSLELVFILIKIRKGNLKIEL